MGKAIVIGIIIVLVIIGVLAYARYFKTKGDPKYFAISMACIILLVPVLIFGGIWCF